MFKRRIQIAVAMSILAGTNSAALLAQTTAGGDSNAGRSRLPSPVRSHHRLGEIADAPSSHAPSPRGEFLRVQYLEATADPVARATRSSDEPWALGETWDGGTGAGTVPTPVAIDGAVLPMPHQHQVIQAPRIVPPHGHHSWPPSSWPPASDRTATANPAHPLPHLIHHHTRQIAPAVIPDGTLREVWKSPFSYGYFGASGSRRWIRHFGYRDRDTEWRLR